MTTARYLAAARSIAGTLPQVLENRGLDPAAIRRYLLTETPQGVAWLFAVLDDKRLARIEAYTHRETLHQISTALHGRPVVTSNSSGLRYAVLLSKPPTMPDLAPFPGWRAGLVRVGVDLRGREVALPWADLGHVLVGGMTRYGKSVFLRSLTLQALQEGQRLALIDPQGVTFQAIASNPALLAPIGGRESWPQVLESVFAELRRRADLFTAEGVDSLAAYNERTAGSLPRLLVIVEEYNGLVESTGGVGGDLAGQVARLGWESAKFGVSLVLAGQDFSKRHVGPVRAQLKTRVCFRVENSQTSNVVLGRSGAERLTLPGRALVGGVGVVQCYYLAGLEAAPAGDGLTVAERDLAARLLAQGGKMTEAALMGMGYSQRESRALQRDWESRGLAERGKDNAYFVRGARFGETNPRTDERTNHEPGQPLPADLSREMLDHAQTLHGQGFSLETIAHIILGDPGRAGELQTALPV